VTPPNDTDVREAIHRIYDPCSRAGDAPLPIDDLGLVRRVEIAADGVVRVVLGLTSPGCLYVPHLSAAVVDVVGSVDGVSRVEVEVDARFMWNPSMMTPSARASRERRLTPTRVSDVVRPRQWQQQAVQRRVN
jgi:ATP-binding protein involved in chromosome partitioning